VATTSKPGAKRGHPVAVAHPHLVALAHLHSAVEQRAPGHGQEGAAELAALPVSPSTSPPSWWVITCWP
jgi:hypothetical protein